MLNLKNGCKFASLCKSGSSHGAFKPLSAALVQNRHERNLHEIPEKLSHIPTAENPRFFDMVEYFFHRACKIAADKLVEDIKTKMSLEDKKKKVIGILKIMQPCDHIIEISFPVRRDCGNYEMVTGYRAQHSTHRMPCKGGSYPFYLAFSAVVLYDLLLILISFFQVFVFRRTFPGMRSKLCLH